MPAVSIRVSTRTATGTSGDRKHNEREGQQPDYVDSSRTHHNSVPIPMPSTDRIKQRCLQRRVDAYVKNGGQRAPRSIRRDAALTVSGIVTFSSDAQSTIDALPKAEQDRRFEQAAQAVADQLGTDLIGLAVHRDESATHAHFTLLGHGQDGKPLSKKMTKAVTSKMQDIGATAFADLGISRGEKLGTRIARGDDPRQYINRSVKQLHRDLPGEIAAKQAEVEAKQFEIARVSGQLDKALSKLEAAEGKNAKLEKRVKTYENRLEAKQGEFNALQKDYERLADMVTIPDPKTLTVPDPKSPWLGVFHREPGEKQYRVYGKNQMKQQSAKAEKAVRESDNLKKAVDDVHTGFSSVAENPEQQTAYDKIADLSGPYQQRYGLIVKETDSRISIPPQHPASPRQIAAALYRGGREKNWKGMHVSNVSHETAKVIMKMASKDGILDTLSFNNPQQQRQLKQAQKQARESAIQAERAKAAEAAAHREKAGIERVQQSEAGFFVDKQSRTALYALACSDRDFEQWADDNGFTVKPDGTISNGRADIMHWNSESRTLEVDSEYADGYVTDSAEQLQVHAVKADSERLGGIAAQLQNEPESQPDQGAELTR